MKKKWDEQTNFDTLIVTDEELDKLNDHRIKWDFPLNSRIFFKDDPERQIKNNAIIIEFNSKRTFNNAKLLLGRI